jgi:ribosomal-protein-alanine N-acetyltransferase
MTTIETSRLLLRPLKLTDLEDLAQIYSDPEVMRYRLFPKPASLLETQAFLESYIEHWQRYGFGRWAIIYKELLNELEVNYLLASQYWGQGLATESAIAVVNYGFQVQQFERLVALAKPDNLASLRVMEKIGMSYHNKIRLHNVEWTLYEIKRQLH